VVLEIHAQAVPLRTSLDGVVYIGQTRVPLETVVAIFNEGSSPEEIAMQLPALTLSHIYQTIGYYLAHQEEVSMRMLRRQKNIRNRFMPKIRHALVPANYGNDYYDANVRVNNLYSDVSDVPLVIYTSLATINI
jgi:uncharacterized protein (DUF433 family)